MIFGVGSDIVDIRRIARVRSRYGERFVSHVFTQRERAYIETQKNPDAGYAKRFAGKEAVCKALGHGIRPPLTWTAIEITSNHGRPVVILAPHAQAHYENIFLSAIQVDISLSDEYPYAQAFAVVSRRECG